MDGTLFTNVRIIDGSGEMPFDGDPLANIGILCDRDKLLAIMKNGKFHKRPVGRVRSFEQAAE